MVPKALEEYIHYKTLKTYKVITIALDVDTKKEVVVYQDISSKKVYVRPVEQWFEEVDGIPRFKIKLL